MNGHDGARGHPWGGCAEGRPTEAGREARCGASAPPVGPQERARWSTRRASQSPMTCTRITITTSTTTVATMTSEL